MHLPSAEGWPALHQNGRNTNALRRIGKSDVVIDLLTHLAYVDERELPIAGNSTKQIDYFTKRTIKDLIDADEDDLTDVI